MPFNPRKRLRVSSDGKWNRLPHDEYRERLLPGISSRSRINNVGANDVGPYTFTSCPLPSKNDNEPSAGTTTESRPRSEQYTLSFESTSTISAEDFETCFRLIETTSSTAYKASSSGWHQRAKRKEMELLDMKYLLLRAQPAGKVLAFLSFMLTMEDDFFVLYVYEIHLSEELQGRGVGAWMMGVAEDVGKRARVEKLMLTVWRSNQGAIKFYKRLGWEVDEFSPGPRKMRGRREKECEYVIMSKLVRGENKKNMTKTKLVNGASW